MTLSLQRTALMFLAASALGATPAMARTHHHHAAKKGHHGAGHAAASQGGGGELVTVPGEAETYVVKKGDTLAKIADQLGTTVADLKRDNKLKGNEITPGQTLKGPAGARKAYVVRHGDTTFSIAKRFHVTVADLRSANGLSSKTQIHSGQKLILPAGFKAPSGVSEAFDEGAAGARRGRAVADQLADEGATRGAAGRVEVVAGGAKSYKVRKGDTLEKVADKLGTSVAQLKRDNHLKRNAIRAGQVLKGPKTGTSKVYVAASGDTLAAIAQRFGVSVQALKSANGMKRHAGVRGGQRLHLPAGARDRGGESVERAPTARPREPLRGEVGPTLPSRPQPYQPSGAPPPRTVVPGAPPTVVPTPTPGPTDAQISQLGRGKFAWPLTGDIITDFGSTATGQRNDGLNIRAPAGAPVRAAAEGEVVYAGDQAPGFGNLVLVKHADGWVTVYAYLSRIDVKNQQKLTQGQQVGQAGQTGGVSEPQLHFEVRYAPNPAERAKPIDPKLVLPPK